MNQPSADATIATNILAVRGPRRVRTFYFERHQGEAAPQRVPLNSDKAVIGRATDADIQLTSQRVSRQHAFVTRTGNDYSIRDNDSHNGIFLNGLKIHSAVLRDGDVVQIGDASLIFREG